MSIENKYPYTDFHELNLDYLLQHMRELEIKFDEFEVRNSINFDGEHSISKQYPAWTIVNDGEEGWISIKPVPAGIELGDPRYWSHLSNYTELLANMQNRIVELEQYIINVKDFKTLTNSWADAFDAAIAYMLVNRKNRILWIPTGVYHLDRTVKFENMDNYEIRGGGEYGTVIYVDGDFPAFTLGSTSRMKFNNLQIQCQGLGQGFDFLPSNDHVNDRQGQTDLEKIQIIDFVTYGINFDSYGGYNYFKRIFMNTGYIADAFRFGSQVVDSRYSVNYIYIEDCQIAARQNTVGTSGHAIYANNLIWLFMSHCDVCHYTGSAVLFETRNDMSNDAINNIMISNNSFFDNTRNLVFIRQSDANPIRLINICNNMFYLPEANSCAYWDANSRASIQSVQFRDNSIKAEAGIQPIILRCAYSDVKGIDSTIMDPQLVKYYNLIDNYENAYPIIKDGNVSVPAHGSVIVRHGITKSWSPVNAYNAIISPQDSTAEYSYTISAEYTESATTLLLTINNSSSTEIVFYYHIG